MPVANRNSDGLEHEPFWYKSGVIYELHVRAFYDPDGTGTGNFQGLTQKLDYIRDLGVTAVWLLPFYPSPLRDDGYDIADYYNIHPRYGNLADFKVFLREAHRRGLRVITELVMNHTSDQHPWFQRARTAKPNSRWRNFYVWSDDPNRYKDARIIFKDVETSNWTWDAVAKAHYWHRFFNHQPDLNFDNPEVHQEMIKAVDFWLDLGVDGLRLDAVPYLYEREGTSCENLPETHAFLKKLREHVDKKYQDRMLLAEANQWPEDAVAYFGQSRGDECHMAFHFPLMPRLFMALRMEDRAPIVEILEQTPPIPETSQWALFLRNHDELTLEMVTDEERDYMYRMYAHVTQARLNLGIRRRLAPLLGNDRKRIELLKALLFSLPGTPVLYYGDEIGMGENIYLGDRNGVRTPMQWSSDRNAGFSRANPQTLYLPVIVDPEYHYEANNVEAQLQNPHSLLWWVRRLLALRKRWRALGEGRCEFLQPENRKVLSYLLRHDFDTILVVANLSRFPQPVELDLSPFQSSVPIELFGHTPFPVITDRPYSFTLGPHAFYWFSLEPQNVSAELHTQPQALPALEVTGPWHTILNDRVKGRLEAILPAFIRQQRWFGAKAKHIKLVTVKDSLPVQCESSLAYVLLLDVDYFQGDSDQYALPVAFAAHEEATRIRQQWPRLIIADLTLNDKKLTGLLYDATVSAAFSKALLDVICRRRALRTAPGEWKPTRTHAFRHILGDSQLPEPTISKAEQSNSSIVFGDKFILKLFRRLEPGINPELELGQFLTHREFQHVPPLAGGLEYCHPKQECMTLASLSGFIPNATDAWQYTLDALSRYYDRVGTFPDEPSPAQMPDNLQRCLPEPLPASMSEIIGTYLESARLLGQRTAELHLVLASEPKDPAFAPEPFTPHYVRGLYQSMRNRALRTLRLLRKQLKSLSPEVTPLAQQVLDLETDILQSFLPLLERRISGKRTRIHGDYHLGQVLYTGKDFLIIDFEGEPAVALTERRLKRSPLQDVAGLVRSFHYAAYSGLYQQLERGRISPGNLKKMELWTRFWNGWVSVDFLKAYLETIGRSEILPQNLEELCLMLRAQLLHKALYEVGYELNHRPDWLKIPLQGILHLIKSQPA